VVDFWLGIRASWKEKKDIRPSTAIRRSINKFIDHVCYLSIGGVLGIALAAPYGISPILPAATIILLAIGAEFDSIVGHFCVLHGYHPFSVYRFVFGVFKRRRKDIASDIEESLEKARTDK
jgi:hypothetical protein